MNLPFEKMIEEHIDCDRIIILSDTECNDPWYSRHAVQVLADQYRKETGKDIWVHAIDLMGYGTQQFHGPKTNIISGWSEKVLEFISLAEEGYGSLIDKIENYKVA